MRAAGHRSSSLEPRQPNPHATIDLNPLTDRQRSIVNEYAPPGHIFDVPHASPAEILWRHSGWAVRRAKIDAAMVRIMTPAQRQNRFRQCGAQAWVEKHIDGSLRVVSFQCGDRLCEACGRARSTRIAGVLAQQIQARPHRFVTLTLQHSQMPLTQQIQRLYQCFVNLRRSVTWKSHVVGGAAFCEIKRSSNTGKWHVHLHLLVEGSYLPQRELSAAWHVATGDSRIVDIRAVPSAKDVARYVSKYVTKPIDSSVYADPDALDEAIVALRGRRLCTTFGSWRGIELSPEKPTEEGWSALARMDVLRQRAALGDDDARRIVEAVTRNRRITENGGSDEPDG